jgi:hypothetical protein
MLMEQSEDPSRLLRGDVALVMIESTPKSHEKRCLLVDNRRDVINGWCDWRASRGECRRNAVL